jgi:hypothetical protein
MLSLVGPEFYKGRVRLGWVWSSRRANVDLVPQECEIGNTGPQRMRLSMEVKGHAVVA